MQIAIWGVRDAGHIKEQLELKEKNNFRVDYFVDNDTTKWGMRIDDTLILSPQELKEKYQQGEIEAVLVCVRNVYNRWFITEQVKTLGIKKIGLVKPSVMTYKWDLEVEINSQNELLSRYIVWLDEIKKPLIYYLEVHAMDGCNLNCKGCLHFSNLYGKDEKPDMQETLKDVEQLSKQGYIFHLRVLGGEPLLNESLDMLLVGLRKILPDSDISVVTNGILIPKQSPKLFQVMRENEIGFNITLYPPTHHMKEVIYDVLDKHGVSYGSHMAKINEFSKGLKLHETEGEITSHTKCVSKNCFFLRRGRLYKCALEPLIERLNKKFDVSFKSSLGIDVYDEDLEWENILESLYKEPVELCKFCSNHLELFEWGVANPPRLEDWIIEK